MTKNRLEAFSDGVLAIIITIMVLELKLPVTDSVFELVNVIPTLVTYLLSFLYVGIYWNNHHALINEINSVNTKILWSNLTWLFCCSLIPFGTSWIREFYTSTIPVMFYGIILLLSAISYNFLQKNVDIERRRNGTRCQQEVDKKGKSILSVTLYIIAVALSWILPVMSEIIYLVVALMWFVPDKQINFFWKQNEIINKN